MKSTREGEVHTFGPGYRRATLLARWFGGAGVISFGLGQLGSSALVVLALICLAVSLWQTTLALRNAASFYRVEPATGYMAAGIGGMISLWGGFLITLAGLFAGAPLVILVGIALTLLTRPLLKVAQSWLPGTFFHLR